LARFDFRYLAFKFRGDRKRATQAWTRLLKASKSGYAPTNGAQDAGGKK